MKPIQMPNPLPPTSRCGKCGLPGLYYFVNPDPSNNKWELTYEDGTLHKWLCKYIEVDIYVCRSNRDKYPLLFGTTEVEDVEQVEATAPPSA